MGAEEGEGVAGISALGSEGAGFSADAGFSVVVGAGVRVTGAGAGLGAGEVSFADFRDSNFSFRYLIRYLTMVGSHSGFSFLSFSRRWIAVSYFSRPWEF